MPRAKIDTDLLASELIQFAEDRAKEARSQGYRECWTVGEACEFLGMGRSKWKEVRTKAQKAGLRLALKVRRGYCLAEMNTELVDLPLHQARIGKAILTEALPETTLITEKIGLPVEELRKRLTESGIPPRKLVAALKGFDLQLTVPEFLAVLEPPKTKSKTKR